MQFHGQDIGHGSGFGGASFLPLLAIAWRWLGLQASAFMLKSAATEGLN
ncbi:MAG: hypothetical protein WBK19_15800 [Azonexus sp.]